MNYVGNDIVAYTHPRCANKWQHKAFIEKILTQQEQQLLQNATYKNETLWAMWTIKEAAYKLSCFTGNRNHFSAIQYEVQELEIDTIANTTLIQLPTNNLQLPTNKHYEALVQYNGTSYKTYTTLTNNYIHSLVMALHTPYNSIKYGIATHSFITKNDYSLAVRNFAMQQLAIQNIHCYAIDKDANGIPYCIVTGNKHQYISLSHDQQFIAFAFV